MSNLLLGVHIKVDQGLVNVLIKHHPTIGDISSPTDICFGDVKEIPKKGHLLTPVDARKGMISEL